MPLISIESLDDPRLDVYRGLNRSNLTRLSGSFIAEGEKLVRRLVASGHAVRSILVDERFVPRVRDILGSETLVFVADRAQLEQLIGFHFHRGVLACGGRPEPLALRQLVPPPPEVARLAVCVDVQDPENLGGILRSSAALGANGVVVSRRCADPYSRRVLRVSMGTVFTLPVYESPDLQADLVELRDGMGVDLVATVLDETATPLRHAPVPDRVALLLGSEGAGLERRWTELCQQRVTITMHRGTDSLNVSVAAGIFLYHFMRT